MPRRSRSNTHHAGTSSIQRSRLFLPHITLVPTRSCSHALPRRDQGGGSAHGSRGAWEDHVAVRGAQACWHHRVVVLALCAIMVEVLVLMPGIMLSCSGVVACCLHFDSGVLEGYRFVPITITCSGARSTHGAARCCCDDVERMCYSSVGPKNWARYYDAWY